MPSSSLDLVTSTNKPETHDDNRYEIVIFYTCKLQFRLENKLFWIHNLFELESNFKIQLIMSFFLATNLLQEVH